MRSQWMNSYGAFVILVPCAELLENRGLFALSRRIIPSRLSRCRTAVFPSSRVRTVVQHRVSSYCHYPE